MLWYLAAKKDDQTLLILVRAATSNGREARLMHSSIPHMKIDGDTEQREIICQGWADLAFSKLEKFFESAMLAEQ